jgi:Uma2 family endonuclease
MATQAQTLVSFEEFAQLPDQEGVWLRELDEGVVIEMGYPSLKHGTVQGNGFSLLKQAARQIGADYAISQNAGFRLAANTSRGPDICLLRRDRLASMEVRWGAHFGAPDLVVEVISPSETAVGIERKIRQYLRAGVVSVWVMYHETRHVVVYRSSGRIDSYESGQSIEEPELFPGVALPVDELFAGI